MSNQIARAPRDMNKKEIISFLDALKATWPDAKTELKFSDDPFTFLICVVLSAQATDVSVNKATPALFKVASTPQKMAKLGADKIGEYIRTIGLWRNKARNVARLSQQIVEQFNGQVPQNRADLESLAGVGRKTANVVLNVAFGQPTVPVDTHVFRISNRSGLARGKNVLEVEQKLEKNIPQEYLRDSHHWLILQGRYICKARKPQCWRCKGINSCLFKDKNLQP